MILDLKLLTTLVTVPLLELIPPAAPYKPPPAPPVGEWGGDPVMLSIINRHTFSFEPRFRDNVTTINDSYRTIASIQEFKWIPIHSHIFFKKRRGLIKGEMH